MTNLSLGYFMVFVGPLSCGLTLPPSCLLLAICLSLGLCVSQIVSNSLLIFAGFYEVLGKQKLPLMLDYFHALFLVRWVKTSPFFYFQLRIDCHFLENKVSNRGPWKEKFFYVRDDWDVAAPWSSAASKIYLNKIRHDLQTL